MSHEPVAHVSRCFGEYPENRGSNPNQNGQSDDSEPHGQMLGRMRRVAPIDPRTELPATGEVTCPHEAGIKYASSQYH